MRITLLECGRPTVQHSTNFSLTKLEVNLVSGEHNENENSSSGIKFYILAVLHKPSSRLMIAINNSLTSP